MMKLTKRQNEIVQASIEIISVGGIQNFTTKALALELGISEPAIYRHFKNKMEILLTMLKMMEEGIQEFQKVITKGNISFKLIENMFAKLINQIEANPALTAIIFAEEIFQNDKRLSDMVLTMMNERQKFIHTIIESEQKSGNIRKDISAEQLSLIIIGSFRLNISRWKLSGYSFDLKEVGKNTWSAIESLLIL